MKKAFAATMCCGEGFFCGNCSRWSYYALRPQMGIAPVGRNILQNCCGRIMRYDHKWELLPLVAIFYKIVVVVLCVTTTTIFIFFS